MRYYGNRGFIFAWDLGVIFLCVQNFKISRFRKKKINLGLKSVIEKCIYLFFAGFFRLKSVKKCVFVINLKNAMLPMKSVFINVEESVSKFFS